VAEPFEESSEKVAYRLYPSASGFRSWIFPPPSAGRLASLRRKRPKSSIPRSSAISPT